MISVPIWGWILEVPTVSCQLATLLPAGQGDLLSRVMEAAHLSMSATPLFSKVHVNVYSCAKPTKSHPQLALHTCTTVGILVSHTALWSHYVHRALPFGE